MAEKSERAEGEPGGVCYIPPFGKFERGQGAPGCFDGISAKVLSTELKDLELNGFIRRKVHTGTPVLVEYELTDYCETLDDVLHALSSWGAMHRETVKKSMRKKRMTNA